MIAGRISGSVIERNVRSRLAPRSNAASSRETSICCSLRHQHEDRVRQRDHDVPDDHGQDRARDPERVEEEEQRDPEDDVGDDERTEEERRRPGLEPEVPPGQRDRGEDPEHDRAEARERRDDRGRFESGVQVRVVQELAVPVQREPRERERRHVGVVEGEDQEDHDRRVEERDDQREEPAEHPLARSRDGDVHQSAATCRGWRKRANTIIRAATHPSRKMRQDRARLPVGEARLEQVDDLVSVHVAGHSADERRRDELAERRDEDEQERGHDPGSESGSVTRRKAWVRLAPRSVAASSSRAVEVLEGNEDRQRDERQPDVDEHEDDREPAVEKLRDGVIRVTDPRPRQKAC